MLALNVLDLLILGEASIADRAQILLWLLCDMDLIGDLIDLFFGHSLVIL